MIEFGLITNNLRINRNNLEVYNNEIYTINRAK